jgi:hypothetical protein
MFDRSHPHLRGILSRDRTPLLQSRVVSGHAQRRALSFIHGKTGSIVEEYGASKRSLMPDGLENALTVHEFRDLVTFLESLK